MGDFKQNNQSGGVGQDLKRIMHKAVCSECGKDCEVPFKPTGEKPVFCNDCFKNKRHDTPGRFNSGNKKMYKAICDKCGKECEVPFNPTKDKPVYCNQCFNKGDKNKISGQAGSQFEIINSKLDKILKALSTFILAEDSEKKKPAKKIEISKPKKTDKSKKKKVVSPKKTKVKAKTKKKK